jgi:hypothetical protein
MKSVTYLLDEYISLHLRCGRHTVTDAEVTQDICHRRILHLLLMGLCGELLV